VSITGVLGNDTLQFYLVLTGRLILACVLGGIVGYERENMHRPAGFRTHILVCVGSALVMITSEFIFKRYQGIASLDPTRLGAQVISGIGFLGAGTIIREGFSVKGLTTAASLWAVSCVGIAAGIGFYEGAVAATVLIYITLILLKRIEDNFSKKNQYKVLYVHSKKIQGQIGAISCIFDRYYVEVKNIEFINNENEENLLMKFIIRLPNNLKSNVMDEMHKLDGISKVYEE
jgi:putative Mg2+ transporter-C (MgtC) family protein